ncbi:heavy metal-associated isoprenylated plant protein 9-like isoform X1 [Senna tora]|uniref:Heavy metal-associated isoprenylated plant protein 9-like isoform X1 n=1 Tax=Senna tora TaxID=362788 RepID=A0A834THG6_9FABA|nr:heavy metal-associated isoprenylated plant protein 9-like isoform X1 [Senna tora]
MVLRGQQIAHLVKILEQVNQAYCLKLNNPSRQRLNQRAKARRGKASRGEEPKPQSPCVLFVDLDCVGCDKKIQRSILKIKDGKPGRLYAASFVRLEANIWARTPIFFYIHSWLVEGPRELVFRYSLLII